MPRRVLIFDDDEDTLAICSHVLASFGWEVHTRSDCDNIFNALETVKPSVIFMDNGIRNQSGVAATQMIKSHSNYKNIPVILFSANSEIKDLANKAGADTYLEKPFNIRDLERVINLVSAIQMTSKTP